MMVDDDPSPSRLRDRGLFLCMVVDALRWAADSFKLSATSGRRDIGFQDPVPVLEADAVVCSALLVHRHRHSSGRTSGEHRAEPDRQPLVAVADEGVERSEFGGRYGEFDVGEPVEERAEDGGELQAGE